MAKFWELFERSVILQGVITIGLLATMIYMWVACIEVPDALTQAFWVVLGFWFGSKVQHEANAANVRNRKTDC